MAIVGVLIAAGLTGIVALGIGQILCNLFAAQNALKARSDADNFTQQVRAHLGSKSACTNSFFGIDLSTISTAETPSADLSGTVNVGDIKDPTSAGPAQASLP